MKAMELDLPWLEMIGPLIAAVAESFGLDPLVVAAIISRESGAGRLLGKWGNPPDTGDKGHGRGLMQIDDRWHKGFVGLGDLWRNPAANLAYGCGLLRENLDRLAEAFPDLDKDKALRAALAGYNCGMGRVERHLIRGRDVDSSTTGKDYSRDVLKRAAWLREKNFLAAD